MIRYLKLTVILAFLAVGIYLVAQQASLGQAAAQNRAEQQARRQAVLDLVREIMPREMFDRMISQMMDGATRQMRAQVQSQGNTLPPDFDAKMKRVVNSVMSYEEMMHWSADVYAKRFTLAEIKELRNFYHTPLGQKITRQMPDIMNDIMQKVTATITTRMPEAMKKEGLIPAQADQQ
jgi:uncharacterized protein